MREGRPSATALFVACARGAAGIDPIARRLVPRPFALLARAPIHRVSPLAPLVALMLVRTRAIDEVVQTDARRGTVQVVILGAGLCARAWRLGELGDSIVYEVDHPATQAYKRSRLGELVPTAREVRFVAVDFERDDLRNALEKAGHSQAAPTTWIWEGVTPYLTPEAIAGTLTTVQALSSPGSTIALTYYPPSDWREHPMVRAVSLGARFLGEPFVGLMHTDEMHALLEQSGFGVDDDATNSELARRMGLVSAWPAIEERIVVATRR